MLSKEIHRYIKGALFILGIGFIGIAILVAGRFISDSSHTDQLKSVSVSYPTFQPTVVENQAYRTGYTPGLPGIDQIFLEDHTWIATLSAEHVHTMIATGDVIPARTVNYKTITYNNFLWAWEETADFLQSADITFINLETPLIPNCPIMNDGFTFCGDERHIEGLRFAGVDVANLGNNHIGNFGAEAVESTVALLSSKSIVPVGVQNPQYIMADGIRFAFLGYNDIGRQGVVAHLDDGTFEDDIRIASHNADVVVVQPHWGIEYTHEPSNRQIEMAHRMIDAGADIIIGNHPHWVQPVEFYKDGVIVYAHGNFIFDQMWSDKTTQGVIGKYTFYDSHLIDIQFTPIIIEDYGRARYATISESQQIINSLKLNK